MLTWEQMQHIRTVVEKELEKLGYVSTGADNTTYDAGIGVTKDGKTYEMELSFTEEDEEDC